MALSMPLATQLIAVRVFDQICDLAQDGRDVNLLRLPALAAGIAAEIVVDFDEPEIVLADIVQSCAAGDTRNATTSAPTRALRSVDVDVALGRALARYHLDGTACDNGRVVLAAVLDIVQAQGFALGRDDIHPDMRAMFAETLKQAVGFDLAAHEICNRVIDIKIAHQRWSLADCIIALSGLSGALLGRVMGDAGIVARASVEEQLDGLMDMMTAEAIRHGFADKDLQSPALPANDNPTQVRFDLIKGIEHLSLTVLEELDMRDAVVQAHAMAKAAGRMVAVASVGDTPEIEGYVSRPMAMLSMQNGFVAAL